MKKEAMPRYLQAKKYLLEQIKRLSPGKNQLEPENTLTEKLGMSRETVRKAMTSLIQDGVITRWHGKGNFGHPAVSNLPMRIDINSDFRRLLTESHYTVRSVRSESSIGKPSQDMLKRMPEANDKEIVSFILSIYGNDQLAIQGDVELLREIVTEIPTSGEYTENMDVFIKEHCMTESNHTTAWLLAQHNPVVSKRFSLPPDTPLLCWEEIYYNLYDEKMGYVKIYFNPLMMDISMMLKF
jgi:GntR family transcriptional regulator